ncbi:tRNA epoxyqueuosine(34) reductase QueG [Methylobacterium sp. NEAU 140]|uniref:tRNA epoxyqueuosine(34) reductase QueG n=1 Tax=Methylobacterium sp. NEAU 140 TaxID=3064945 RepID=UPI002735AC5D|nr:tRNA epoxyqueuosine(34) reductase QueG [Methylobacterium sp. NEAU 140]MDP4022169.1 tRNA epoxyqueuosine(34) reductase QueG [Methylobacterium sp. NEAU 140]
MRRLVEARARHLGFCGMRITRPDRVPELPGRLSAWLAAGAHGTMDWMAERADQRASPAGLWPGVRSVLVLAMSYRPEEDPLTLLDRRDRGAIAAYARRRDYHDVLKGKLKELGGYLSAKGGQPVKVFCDTAPVMEKALAEAAGLGWQGKHTVLISRTHGNWLLLGAIYTSADFEPDAPGRDRCGSCRACLDICPTDAFPAPYRLDARRCISYLTIEHPGPIPEEFRAAIGNRVFGCDDCLAVCPWNKFARTAAEARLAARDDLAAPRLAELAALDDAAFRTLFAGTPVKRTGRDRFLRNVLIALGNSGDPGLAGTAVDRLADASPLVRGMAVWACGRLLGAEVLRGLHARHAAGEADPHVRAEWDRALAA